MILFPFQLQKDCSFSNSHSQFCFLFSFVQKGFLISFYKFTPKENKGKKRKRETIKKSYI